MNNHTNTEQPTRIEPKSAHDVMMALQDSHVAVGDATMPTQNVDSEPVK